MLHAVNKHCYKTTKKWKTQLGLKRILKNRILQMVVIKYIMQKELSNFNKAKLSWESAQTGAPSSASFLSLCLTVLTQSLSLVNQLPQKHCLSPEVFCLKLIVVVFNNTCAAHSINHSSENLLCQKFYVITL